MDLNAPASIYSENTVLYDIIVCVGVTGTHLYGIHWHIPQLHASPNRICLPKTPARSPCEDL